MNQHGNLDTKSAKDVIDILKKVAKDKLVIVVTHNIEQFEECATRIIKMQDGTIIEDKKIKEIAENITAKEANISKIKLFIKYRLGIRNTFNVFSKFAILFAVFCFILIAIFAEYGSLTLYENTKSKERIFGGYILFEKKGDERILIKKQDGSYFTQEDFAKIQTLANIDYIVENDLFLDYNITLKNINLTSSNLTIPMNSSDIISLKVDDIQNLKKELILGRMPQNDKEIVITYYFQQYIDYFSDGLLSNKYKVEGIADIEFQIVGIGLANSYDESKHYFSENMIDKLAKLANVEQSETRVLCDNKYLNSSIKILPSTNVKKGTAIIDNDFNYQVSNGNIKNKELNITTKSIYYEENINVKVANTYVKSNFNKLTGYEDYETNRNVIFISEEDYDNLYDKPSYQASVFVKDIEKIDETVEELIELGIEPKKISDFVLEDANEFQIMLIKSVTVIATVLVAFTLFFISYFIIKIVLKSRNAYYTILRMLGATEKNIKSILDIELFVNSSLAYIVVMGIIYIIKSYVIEFSYISRIIEVLGIKEYVFLYIVLFAISKLISRRYAKSIFKKTAVNTYNEGV